MQGPPGRSYPAETSQHVRLRDAIWARLKTWRRFVVAIDGVDNAGKSTLARYLAWQLGMPAVETDLFLIPNTGTLQYRDDILRAAVHARLGAGRPVIIEGVRVLDTLGRMDLKPDFLVWVEQEEWTGSGTLADEIAAYVRAYTPRDRADCLFTWCLNEDEFGD